MSKKNRKKRGFLVPFLGLENEGLATEFLESPEKFAKGRRLKLRDLACPPEVHKALKRGKEFAAEVEASSLALDPPSIRRMKAIAAKHFGKEYEAAIIPFGLKFRDKVVMRPGLDWTATGTGTITFLDGDGDVDG